MAATVIDSFVVELGLDPTKFNATQKKVVNDFKKGQDELESRAKSTDKAASDAAVSVGGLARQASGVLAAFGAGKFLVDFTTQTITAAAATNRLSNTISASASTLSKWQGLAQTFGGDAGAMASSFTTLSDAFAGWKIGKVSPIISTFRDISTAGGVVIDMNKGVEESILDLAQDLQNIAKGPGGKETAGLLGRQLGLDPATISMMIQSGGQLRAELAKIRGLTDENAAAADKLDQRWNALVLSAQRMGMSTVFGTIDMGTKFFNKLATGNTSGVRAANDDVNPYTGEHMGKPLPAYNSPLPTSPSAGASTSPSASPAGGFRNPDGSVRDRAGLEAFIRQTAIEERIDPRYARAVAGSEGFNNFYSGIAGEKSYGAFQLNRSKNPGRPSLGDQFLKDTGMDPSDPANEAAGIKYALHHAATSGRGWADWYGARNTGVGQFAGIPQGGGGGGGSVTIDTMNIYPPPGVDGNKMATDFRGALTTQQSRAANANSGAQ